MLRWMVAGAMAVSVFAGTASGQNVYAWPAPAAAAGVRTYFPTGTPIKLRTCTEANTKQMKPGDRVYLDVAENLTYRGQVVVPAGAPVTAEVARSERNGLLGKRGQIEIRLLYAETPSGPVHRSGGTAARGREATYWSVPGALFVAWPFVFVHGTSGYIRQGTALTGYLAEPLTFTAASPRPHTAAMTAVQPDTRLLPARFDPSVFGGRSPDYASR